MRPLRKPQTSEPSVRRGLDASPVIIVGAGFSGLCAAIRLKRAGIDDFVVLEQASEVGGTWRDNRYPGAACDVESHLYSFSFEPNPDWTRAFASQREILAYLLRCTDKFGLRPSIRFNTSVTRAIFDDRAGRWSVETSDGHTLSARALILCCGGLSRPFYPEIPGLDSFEGPVFHSARWDDCVTLEGRRVAIIGTGASAIQIVPSIAAQVEHLDVYQRTAPWIVPKPDGPIPEGRRAAFRQSPFWQRLHRWAIYWRRETLAVGFVVWPDVLRLVENLGRRYLARKIKDPDLQARLLPSYAIGCKRILPTNDYYQALSRANVELITEPIAGVRRRAVVGQDGTERPADVIVLATGFKASEPMAPFEIVGRGGQSLDQAWSRGAEAYLGTTVAGFPNLFIIYGPNTALGHSSMIFMIEAQVQYVLSSLQMMRARNIQLVEVRPDVQRRYNERLHARLRKTVWASGCRSWYQTRDGKNTTLWPGFTFEFRMKTRRFDVRNYDLRAASGEALVSSANDVG